MKRFKIMGWNVYFSRERLKKGSPSKKRKTTLKMHRLMQADWRCELCGTRINISCALHHRLPPDHPERGDLKNVLVLCTACHHEVQAHPHDLALTALEDYTRYDGGADEVAP